MESIREVIEKRKVIFILVAGRLINGKNESGN